MNTRLCFAMLARSFLFAALAVTASVQGAKESADARKINSNSMRHDTVLSQSVIVSSIPDAAAYNFESFDQKWIYQTGFARSLGLYALQSNQLKPGCSVVSHAEDRSTGGPVIQFKATVTDPSLAELALQRAKALTPDQLIHQMTAATHSRSIVSVQVPVSEMITVMPPKRQLPGTKATPSSKAVSPQISEHSNWLVKHWLVVLAIVIGLAVLVGAVAFAQSTGVLSLQAYFYRIGGANKSQNTQDSASEETRKLLDSAHTFEQHAVLYSES